MQIVFMVAEKPSLAQSIAKSLSFNQFSTRKGFNGACSVHEWTGTFHGGYGRGEQVRYKMTSVCGHVMALNFHHKYNNWDAVDPIELYSASTIKQEANPKLKMVSFLQKEAQGCNFVVLWLDCDKEGENICFEVLDSIEYEMNKACKIYRAKFSAITDQEIRGAMSNLQYPNKLEALSVDARQELDLRIGCAFTRFQTKHFQGKYGDLDSKLISFGPCQTPTLGFCVERHDKIQSFKPESFWVLKIMVACSDRNDQPLEMDWNRGRIFDKAVANMFLGLTKQETKAEILGISVKESLRNRPQALNTVEMLRIASSGLGIGPSVCMSIAEKLYTQGFISYPRTETTHYSDSFDLRGPLQSQRNNPEWGSIVKTLLETGFSRPRKGTDAGDHPPITPMRSANPGELSGDGQRLYDYIARHYIATLMPDCRTEVRKITLRVGEMETFTLTGRRMIDPGFLSVMPWLSQDDVTLPGNMTVGQKLDIVGAPSLREGQTGPPDYLTESELISKMEKHGIGTDASIPVHIQNIVERNYVQIIAGRKVQPTKLGIVLVHGYQQIDPELVLPHMRSAVEEQLDLIAKGKADYQAVVNHTITVFSAKFKYFVENIAGMNELFDDSFSNLADTGKPLTRCGKCNRYMKLITSTPQRLHCGNCRLTCSLPSGGTVRQYKQVKCPLDGFELVVWSQGSKGKSFVLCPYCYTNPPFEDMQRQSGCNKCSHPDCPQSRAKLVVTACLECQFGLLLLDDSNAPRFKLQCNECSVLIMMEPTIIVVNVLTTSCEFCSSQHLQVKLNTKNNADADEMFSGCVFCDKKMCDLMQLEHANFHNSAKAKRGGGQFRRGGRRGGRRGRR